MISSRHATNTMGYLLVEDSFYYSYVPCLQKEYPKYLSLLPCSLRPKVQHLLKILLVVVTLKLYIGAKLSKPHRPARGVTVLSASPDWLNLTFSSSF